MIERLHIAIDADPRTVGVIRLTVQTWLAAMHWPPAAVDELISAICEAVDNSIEHAYTWQREGRVVVEIDITPARPGRVAGICVTDFGQWRPARPMTHRGNGLALIRAIMATTRIEHDHHGTRIWMCSHPVP